MKMGWKEKADQYTENQWEEAVKKWNHLKLLINGTKPFEQAQICSGGVALFEIDEKTLECRQHRGLYIAGELLDVDGMCGGYCAMGMDKRIYLWYLCSERKINDKITTSEIAGYAYKRRVRESD